MRRSARSNNESGGDNGRFSTLLDINEPLLKGVGSSTKSGVIKDEPIQQALWLRKAKGSGVQSLSLAWKRRYFHFGDESVAWMEDEKSDKALGEALYQTIEGVTLDKADGELVLEIETKEKKFFLTTDTKGTMKNDKAIQQLLRWGSLLQRWISFSTKKPMEIPLMALTARESICVLKHHPGRAMGYVEKAKKGRQSAKRAWKKRYVRVGEKSVAWSENESEAIALGEVPFSSIQTVKIENGLLVVKSIKKTFYFRGHADGDPLESWRVVFLRCLSFGRRAPLIGNYADALPSAIKEQLRLYDAGELQMDSSGKLSPRRSPRKSPRKSPRQGKDSSGQGNSSRGVLPATPNKSRTSRSTDIFNSESSSEETSSE